MTDEGVLKLRDEILEFEKASFELQRWKLIGTGAALTIGLGFAEKSGAHYYLALLAVPFVVAYCDLVARDYDLRTAVLARFIREEGGVLGKYEEFSQNDKSLGGVNPYKLGSIATDISSYAANCAVAVFGIYFGGHATGWRGAIPFALLAIAGAIATFLVDGSYRRRWKAINGRLNGPPEVIGRHQAVPLPEIQGEE